MAGYGGYGDGGYAYAYQASTSYSPFPDATHLLDGPGSSAYVRAPGSGSLAYAYANGAVSVSSFDFGADSYQRYSSYSYHGTGGSLTTAYSYGNYAIETPGGFQEPHGYYTAYPAAPGRLETRSSYSVTTTAYDGADTYRTFTSEGSYTTSYGYTVSSYERETSEAVGEHQVAGSGQLYEATAVSDLYGYTTYTSHSSTF